MKSIFYILGNSKSNLSLDNHFRLAAYFCIFYPSQLLKLYKASNTSRWTLTVTAT